MKPYYILILGIITHQTTQSRCPWGDEPVCGVDYITYPNQCALAAAYVEMKYPGPCTKILADG